MNMKVTTVENLSNENYHNSEKYKEYWSSSNEKGYAISPREAFFQKFNAEKNQTPDMIFGAQLHDYLAAQHVNGQPFCWNPVYTSDIRKPDGSEYVSVKASVPYKKRLESTENPIDQEDYEKIEDIWDVMRNSEIWWKIEEILTNGTAELSVFIDEDSGYKYKARFDVVTEDSIYDWKTAAKTYWSIPKFKRRVEQMGYDVSAAMYQWAEYQRTGIWKRFFLVWILKERPYDVLIADISKYCYEPIDGGTSCIKHAGAILFERLKAQHEACIDANNWPGLSAQFEGGIAEFEPSRYYTGDYEEFETE